MKPQVTLSMDESKLSFYIMKSNLIIGIFISLLALSCKMDKVGETTLPTSINTLTPEQAIAVITDVTQDTCGTLQPGSINISKPKATNQGEEKADDNKLEQIKKDLEKSKFEDCQEIITEYQKAILALKNGNLEPIKQFPEGTDPKIAICIRIDPSFAARLDSLRKIGKVLVEDVLKKNDKF